MSKGTALRELLRGLGIEVSEVVAVGNNWNDVEMLEAAGLGIAIGNAPAGVRARADHQCRTVDEERVREVIDRFVLGRR